MSVLPGLVQFLGELCSCHLFEFSFVGILFLDKSTRHKRSPENVIWIHKTCVLQYKSSDIIKSSEWGVEHVLSILVPNQQEQMRNKRTKETCGSTMMWFGFRRTSQTLCAGRSCSGPTAWIKPTVFSHLVPVSFRPQARRAKMTTTSRRSGTRNSEPPTQHQGF